MEGLWDWIMDKTLVTEEKFNKITKKVGRSTAGPLYPRSCDLGQLMYHSLYETPHSLYNRRYV